jgi:hypothetical protein
MVLKSNFQDTKGEAATCVDRTHAENGLALTADGSVIVLIGKDVVEFFGSIP